jgi:CRISPR-associated endonuclease/helicase Cas3
MGMKSAPPSVTAFAESTAFYAHSAENRPQSEWHRLEDHLRAVAQMAEQFAQTCIPPGWACLTGQLHDLGKFSKEFQDRLAILTGTDLPAHLEGAIAHHVDHSTAGAQYAVSMLGDKGRVIAYTIAGHHAGLPDGLSNDEGCLQKRLQKVVCDWSACPASLKDLDCHLTDPWIEKQAPLGSFQVAFFIRFLFSCLVDADFLDTEHALNLDAYAERRKWPPLASLHARLDTYLAKFMPDSPVNQIRADVLRHCLVAADNPPGLFSLTVPTGGGKTLSSLAFALKHARQHGLERVIYVIPYTSIIEQNADVFRAAIGHDAVLEHHSNFDPEKETQSSRLACENWAAPLIVTTNVQFFESLFAAKPSACRKLHNIARSVIILDEAQMLPPDVLRPCLEALRELVRAYHTTIVLCTATQPAFSTSAEFKNGLDNVTEIIPNPHALHAALKRVRAYRCDKLSTNELAEKLSRHGRVLCIVNTRAHARLIAERLPDSIHLSALMCPAHRSKVLADIRATLAQERPCRVVSTQLIEAGVDIDFPVVYRALTGIDSLAQAAGRCNREGTQTQGQLFIFEPESGVLTGHLLQAAQEAQLVLRQHVDPLSLEAVEQYFRALFWIKGDKLDKYTIMSKLAEGAHGWIPFRSVADQFKIIDDATKPVVIPWDDHAYGLIERARHAPSITGFARKLQRYTVAVYPNEWHTLLRIGALELVHEQFPVLASMPLYDARFGLQPLAAFIPSPNKLMC